MSDSLTPEQCNELNDPDTLCSLLRYDECDALCAHPCLKSRRIRVAAAEMIERLVRREYVCVKCGIRKDGEIDGQPDF